MEKIKCTQCGTGNSINSKYCCQCGYELPKTTIEAPVSYVQSSDQKDKGSIIKKILGFIVGAAVMIGIQQYFLSPPSYDKGMMEIASELNKTCPIMIDAETRLDNAIALPGNIFQYNYTLINLNKEMVDTVKMRISLEPSIINFVRTNPQMKALRDHKTTINYFYRDKTEHYLLTISVSPENYN